MIETVIKTAVVTWIFTTVLCFAHGWMRVGYPKLEDETFTVKVSVFILSFAMYLVLWPLLVREIVDDIKDNLQ